jgi:hypothetical protein
LQALLPLCSSRKGLICSIVMGTRESHFCIYYNRLGVFAKLATTYVLPTQLLQRGAYASLTSFS